MKFFIIAVALLLVACSDDDSDFVARPSGWSSSSVCEDCDGASSSSVTSLLSSSSIIRCKTATEDTCQYGKLIDARDGQVYKTVKIGRLWWMAENLNYEVEGSYCYNDSAEYCVKYGRLYLWSAAMDSLGQWSESTKGCGDGLICDDPSPVQGICPEGWYLPSGREWYSLFETIDGKNTAGKYLKSTSGWIDGGNGLDAYGFSVLPAGSKYGNFQNEGKIAYFWEYTDISSGAAYNMELWYDADCAYIQTHAKSFALSIRCYKEDL